MVSSTLKSQVDANHPSHVQFCCGQLEILGPHSAPKHAYYDLYIIKPVIGLKNPNRQSPKWHHAISSAHNPAN